MKKLAVGAALSCVPLILSLAACGSHVAAIPPVSLQASSGAVPEKSKLLIVESYAPNFGTNKIQFEETFRSLATACRVSIDFFDNPQAGGQLALDPDGPSKQAEFNRKALALQPDGILEVNNAGWSGSGGMASNPGVQLQSGTFKLTIRLVDGKTRKDQWHTLSASVQVTPQHGGDRLAEALISTLSGNGAFPHCPPRTGV